MLSFQKRARSAYFVIVGSFVCLIIAWKIFVSGISSVYEGKILENNDAVDISLAWSENLPSVQYKASQDASSSATSSEKEDLLISSLKGNPSDGRVLISLADLWFEGGSIEKADQAVQLATKSLPSDAYTQIRAASYWLKRNDLDRAISNWNMVLQTTPAAKLKLFPLFLSWVEENKIDSSLERVVQNPPKWWAAFFNYVSKNASSIYTLDKMYDLRKNSGVPLTENETRDYISRLKRDELWPEAFIVWLNGLGVEGMKYLGQPYNGNFETKLSQTGFGWNNVGVTGVFVETGHTYGNKGSKALHITFKGRNTGYKHLYQPMFLAPAAYVLRGRVRPDSLVSAGGLKWVVRCLSPQTIVIGESERFLGVSQWQTFSFDFEVNMGECVAQELRLESIANKRNDDIISGEIWFDSISIERKEK